MTKTPARPRGRTAGLRRGVLRRPRRSRSQIGGAERGRRLAAGLAVALDLVAHLLAFAQPPEVRALDGRDVHEHVLAAVIRLDEAKALGGVEPLYSSSRHFR